MAITQADRMSIPLADFGWPAQRKYPCRNQDELDAAARLIGHAPASEQPAIKARLIRIAHRKGLTLPDTWEDATT